MKKLRLVYILAISVVFIACSDELTKVNNNKKDILTNEQISNHIIPLDNALNELNNVLELIDKQTVDKNGKLVAKKKREIAKVEVVYRKTANSSYPKGVQKILAPNESLLYVVDFEENMGSAVLAADDRIYTPVLAVTESGSLLTIDDKIPYVQGENYDDTDLTNFSLYNTDEDDYYVGTVDNFVLDVCESYATAQVLESLDEIGYSSSSSNTTYTGPDFGNWIITEKISPKLTTAWHQRSPFNDATPIKKEQRSPAGCVAIAVAQIVAYHEYPRNLTVNGYSINWTKLKNICNRNSPYNDQSSVSSYAYDRQALAQFISTIGIGCRMWYTKNWSFALPKNARNFMSDFLGYTNVARHYDWNDFESNIVYDMLKNDNPVFIAAVSDCQDGHAWVIDGFIQREREILSPTIKAFASTFWGRFLYQNGKQNERLFHCNFGWKGATANGYYYSGLFNKDGSRENAGEIYDDPNAGNNLGYDFDWLYHIITYNHPN